MIISGAVVMRAVGFGITVVVTGVAETGQFDPEVALSTYRRCNVSRFCVPAGEAASPVLN